MNPFVLLAGAEPPSDLATYVGGLVITAFIGGGIARLFGRGDKAEAERKAAESEWRAELRADMKRLLDGQVQLAQTQGLQGKDVAQLTARCDQLDKRQEFQAEAHREAVRSLRSEFESRLTVLKERP